MAESPIDDAIVQTPVERLQAVPSTIDLAGAEIELVSQFSRETRLKKALEPIREGRYDFVLLDCPPSLGLLTVNALTAAEELIVPIQCEYYALEGLGQLLRNVSLVQQNINPELRLSGIVMTMFDPRTKLSSQVVEEVQRFFGDLVYDVIIPRTVRLSEAPGFGQPITIYDPPLPGGPDLSAARGGGGASSAARRTHADLRRSPHRGRRSALLTPSHRSRSTSAELDTLPVPTVHEVVADLQAEVEEQAEAPQPRVRYRLPDSARPRTGRRARPRTCRSARAACRPYQPAPPAIRWPRTPSCSPNPLTTTTCGRTPTTRPPERALSRGLANPDPPRPHPTRTPS